MVQVGNLEANWSWLDFRIATNENYGPSRYPAHYPFAVTNGAQVAEAEENWWVYWRPFLIPLILIISRVWTKWKLTEYPWSVLSSDLCYFGATFYVWALTVRLSKIRVCPPNRMLARDDGEGSYIIVFLIVNFALSFLLYPMKAQISDPLSLPTLALAFIMAIGSPIYLRMRILR